MSTAVPASAPRARPSTVTIAVALLLGAAAIELISSILSIAYAGKIADGAKKALGNSSQAGAAPGLAIGSSIGAIVGFLIIVGLVLLAYFVSRGAQVARILTWVLGGIALCCTVVGFGTTLAGSALWDQSRKQDPTLPTWDEYQRAMYSEVPGWYKPVTTLLGVLLVLAILLAIILLAMPASHPYFRKPQQEWEPPIPGGGPGYPGGGPGYPGSGPGYQGGTGGGPDYPGSGPGGPGYGGTPPPA